MFPNEQAVPDVIDFTLAEFAGTVDETLGDQKAGVNAMLAKINFSRNFPAAVEEWNLVRASRCDRVGEHPGVLRFELPQQCSSLSGPVKIAMSLHINDGLRDVDIIPFSDFKGGQRNI